MGRFAKVIFLCLLNVFAVLGIDLLVETNVGQIRGLSADDGNYTMFVGIPYARVRQDNPFAAAIPQEPFDEVFEAYNDTVVCPQIDEHTHELVGTLDCLHLNVYVPNSADSQNNLPVLVWIHGGRFAIGSGRRFEFGPKYLVRHDVILVTVNYRLGPYGFMCLDTPDVPGNQGLKDQYLALKWVEDNIEAFGGDSKQITIFGESAGSMSIDFHMHSPREKVFIKAIMQSGCSQTITFHAPVLDTPLRLANYLGFQTDDMDAAISFLANSHTDSVITAAESLNILFRPCVEKEFGNVESFITQNWITADVPNINNMPVLIGFNSQEELLENAFYDNLVRDKLEIGFDIDDDAFDGMEDIVKRYYIGDEPITEEVREEMVTFQSDYKFNHPTIRTIRKYTEHGVGDVYFYVFSYVGGRNFARFNGPNVTLEGAAHADELGYLFDVSFLPEPTDADQLVIDRMTTMWTNFVKYSDPTPELSDLLTTEWTPITPGSPQHYLNIDNQLNLDTSPFTSRMAFWDLFYTTNRDLQRIYPGYNVGHDTHNDSNRLLATKFVLLFLLLIAF